MKIGFIGAARTVTSSCYHIQTKDTNILVDCGLFQGTKSRRKKGTTNPSPLNRPE